MTQYKICLVGAYAVGKTSLVGRIVRGLFSEKYLATVGVKIDRKVIRLGEREVRLILWDMAGEDEFAKVNASYLRGASGYLLVMDGTRRGTLDQAVALERRLRATVGKLPFRVLVNKADIREEWEVTDEELADLESLGWPVRPTSAKTGEGVEDGLRGLVEDIERSHPVSP